jgi:predicted nucleotidyltransferase
MESFVKKLSMLFSLLTYRSQESSVGMAMNYVLDGKGSILGKRYFSLLHSFQTGSVGPPSL